jgi:hypothetical protein
VLMGFCSLVVEYVLSMCEALSSIPCTAMKEAGELVLLVVLEKGSEGFTGL